MDAITIRGLSKRYGTLIAVDDVSLSIPKGELFGLLGVNGAGKTTMIKLLTGLTAPTAGDAFLNGYSIKTQPRDIKRVLGVSPQETAVAPQLTVRENLELISGIYGFSKQDTTHKIETLSKRLGLDALLPRKAGKLSGGYARRLSLAMALISDPQLLFLDEPTLGLDVLARSDLWELIRTLKGHMTIVLTTHYMEEAEALCDRIGIMKEGKLLAVDTAEQFKLQTGTTRFEEAFIAVVKGASV